MSLKSVIIILAWNFSKEIVMKLKKLNIKSTNQYRLYWKKNRRPSNIPSAPQYAYLNNGWIDYPSLFGNINYNKLTYLDYSQAKIVIQKFKIKTSVQWIKFRKTKKRPINIPSNPDTYYKNKGWISWADFLGKE